MMFVQTLPDGPLTWPEREVWYTGAWGAFKGQTVVAVARDR